MPKQKIKRNKRKIPLPEKCDVTWCPNRPVTRFPLKLTKTRTVLICSKHMDFWENNPEGLRNRLNKKNYSPRDGIEEPMREYDN